MGFWEDVLNKDNWKLLLDKEALSSVLPTAKEVAIKDPNGKVFKKEWAKAVSENAKYGTPIPKELIRIYKSKTSPTPKEFQKESQQIFKENDNDVPPPPPREFNGDGIKHIPKPKVERKVVLQSLSDRELSRVKWAIEEVGRLKYKGRPSIKHGARSSYINGLRFHPESTGNPCNHTWST